MILKVSPYTFVEMCKYGIEQTRVVQNVVPRDAKYVRAFIDDDTGWGYISLVLESPEFKDLKEGEKIPFLPNPVFEKV